MNNLKLLTGSFMMFGLLVGCSFNGVPSGSLNSDNIEGDLIETYAIKSLMGVKLLSTVLESPYVGSPTGDSWLMNMNRGNEQEALIVSDFTQYIALMDTLLATDTKPIQFEYLSSDNELYAYQVRFIMKDLQNFEQTYMFYYNYQVEDEGNTSEENTSEETSESLPIFQLPLNRHQDREDDEDRHGHDQFSVEGLMDHTDQNDFLNHRGRKIGDQSDYERVVIEGIVIVNEVIYELIGVEVSTDSIHILKFFIALDDQHWIKIQSRIGEHVEGSMIAIKNSNGFYKMHYQVVQYGQTIRIMLRTLLNGVLSSYMFHKSFDDAGNIMIRIKVINDQTVLHIFARGTIDSETGEVIYQIYVRETGNMYDHRPGGRPPMGPFRRN